VQVLPAELAGRSKLKMVEKVLLTPAKYWVPYAVSGWAEATGMMRSKRCVVSGGVGKECEARWGTYGGTRSSIRDLLGKRRWTPRRMERVQEERVQKERVQKQPGQKERVQKQPGQKELVQKQPVQKEPVQKEPVQKEPGQMRLARTEQEQMKLAQWKGSRV
jgi:hypothetical protein